MVRSQSDLEVVDFQAAAARIVERGSNASAEEFDRALASERERDRMELLEGWGVPQRVLRNARSIEDTRIVRAVREWAATESWCLVLSSDKGAGKSTAAGWWLWDGAVGLKYARPTRQWWSGVRLARVDGYDQTLDDITAVGRLVIDDLGVEYQDRNGNLQQRLDFLMDERYANFRKTLITTNLSAKDFRERYGERVADRIREDGVFVEFSDASLRARR